MENQRKNEDPLKKIERTLTLIFIGLGVIVIIGIMFLIKFSGDKGRISEPPAKVEEPAEALSDSTSFLPDNCNLFETIPSFEFIDEAGSTHSIEEFQGKVTVVTFWASWCDDCKEQLPLMNDFLKMTEEAGANYILIDKLDDEKETKEAAISYLTEQEITAGTYFDEDMQAYELLGMHNVPTTFFLDATGRIMAWAPSQITETSVFEAYLENAIKGSGAVTEQFVETSMMDLEGGVHSSYERTSEATLAGDVLSESQGVMLEYAALAGNQELFDKILTFIDTKMLSDKGLTAWWVRKDKASPVSALIDDLRIYDGLNTANELWGGYDTYLEKYRTALAEYGIKDDYFVDFYDSEHKDYATRFTLCYGDLKTMEELSKEDDSFTLPYEHAKEIVENGMISEEFPLFYSWYNLDTEKYEEDELNMAEAMVTLLHLAEVGELPDESLEWLKSAMAGSGVKARYTVEGKVVEGYNFDSTAVYGIIAMIGDTLGDNELRGDALNKMEKMRIVDSSLDYNGAFGLEDGTGITSFDQIMPMLAYEYANN